jgi:hypothetical protein
MDGLNEIELQFEISKTLEQNARERNKKAKQTLETETLTMPKELTIGELIKQGLKKIKSEMDNFIRPFAKHNSYTPPAPPNPDNNEPINPRKPWKPRNPGQPWKSKNPRKPWKPRNPNPRYSKHRVPYPSRQPKNPQYPPRTGGYTIYKGILPTPQVGSTLSSKKPPSTYTPGSPFTDNPLNKPQDLIYLPRPNLYQNTPPYRNTLPIKTLDNLESELGNFSGCHYYNPQPIDYCF